MERLTPIFLYTNEKYLLVGGVRNSQFANAVYLLVFWSCFYSPQTRTTDFFTSGRSHLRVALQIAYEFVLPALFIVGCLICLVLIFQPLVQRLCELIHTHTAQIIRSNDLANLNNNIKFGVRLPKDYPLLIQTVFISNRDWLQIFTKTAWQTLLLLLINFGIGLPLGALLTKIRLLKKSIN